MPAILTGRENTLPRERRGLLGGTWVPLALGLLVAGYLWIGFPQGEIVRANANDYYAQLTEAFLSGQTYLRTPPDPRLKALAKPWQVVPDGIPRLPEAVYFKDRYYLYFGAPPVVLLFAPVRLLLGIELSDRFAVLVGVGAGFAATVGVLLWARRRWFGELAGPWLGLGLLVVTVGPWVLPLVALPMVHGVPIACAYACAMAAVAALAWSLGKGRARHRFGLALVSLGWGLAVACRPNYLFSLPALGLPLFAAAALAWKQEPRRWRKIGQLLAAGIMPAALVGIGVAAYNHARFGRISDFGVRYYIGRIDQTDLKLFSPANLWPNFREFFLHLPEGPYLSAYFPFFEGWSAYWGALVILPVLLFAVAMPLTLLGSRWRHDRTWRILGLTLLAAFLLNVLSILLTTLVVGVAERYLVDFLPFGVLLGVLVAFAGLHGGSKPRPLVVRGLTLAVLGLSLVMSGLIIFMRCNPVARLPGLARAANSVVALTEPWRGIHYGPMDLKLRFATLPVGQREPLLVSGAGRDIVYVAYPDATHIQLGFDHRGSAGPISDPIAVEPNKDYEVRLDLGFLYPPLEHPLLSRLPKALGQGLQHRLVISFAGETVLHSGCVFYPTNPGELSLGKNPQGWVVPGRFSGTVTKVGQSGLPPLDHLSGPGFNGPVRLTLELPRFGVYHNEPLISTGTWGNGDVLYVTYVAPGRIRFGHDSHEGGAVESAVMNYEEGKPVSLEVDMPSLNPAFRGGPDDSLLVRFNDRLVLAEKRPFHRSEPYEVYFGFNGAGSSEAALSFLGHIAKIESIAGVGTGAEGPDAWGPLHLAVSFPKLQSGRSEPLLSTGRTGAGDVIYVQYVDDTHVRFGLDHWGKGGPLSPPLAIGERAVHEIEITMGSLYPSPGDALWRRLPEAAQRDALGRVVVKLDNRIVLDDATTAYPAARDEIRIGLNGIGASSCQNVFTGEIVEQERLGLKASGQ